MAEESRITIVNDTDLPVSCYVYIDSQYMGVFESKKAAYPVSSPESEIKLYKDDQWEDQRFINRIFLFFYSLNFVFGFGTLPENLPLKIDIVIKPSETKQSVIKLSDCISVSSEGIRLWRKYTLFQIIILCLLIILIVTGFSFIFPNVALRILLILAFALADVFLLWSFAGTMKKYSALLIRYMK